MKEGIFIQFHEDRGAGRDEQRMDIGKSKMELESSLSPDEMKEEIPKEIRAAYKLLEEGDYRRAKTVVNSIARMNRQLNLPGIDEELKVLFEKVRLKRAEAGKTRSSGQGRR